MIAIDLGSNTLRVLAYDCSSEEKEAAFETVVKTADGLAVSGMINDAAVQRVIEALKSAQAQLDFRSRPLRAVTTEAIRRASNADKVLQEIKEATDVDFEIITPEEEARLTLLAVKQRLKNLYNTPDTFVLVDIGGGSTELIFCYGKRRISRSFSIGIVTIAQSYENLENIQKALPKEMYQMQIFCTQMYERYGKPDSFVATAGTPTTVAAMKLGLDYETYDAGKINGTLLEIEDLDFYLQKLLKMPFEARERAVGTGRSDLIAAGILIYKEIYRMLDMKCCIVIDDGLREGVAIQMCVKSASSSQKR